MSHLHLLAYKQAASEKYRALTAIKIARSKKTNRLAWHWADMAIEHAEAAGIEDAGRLFVDGDRHWPNMGKLEEALLKLEG